MIARCANNWPGVRMVVGGVDGLGMVVCLNICCLGMWMVDICVHKINVGDVCGPEKGVCFDVCGNGMWLIVVLLCICKAGAVLMVVCCVFCLVMGAVVTGCGFVWGLEKRYLQCRWEFECHILFCSIVCLGFWWFNFLAEMLVIWWCQVYMY